MLEPRRLAARAAARRMASLIGEQAGDTVGYRVRNDTLVSKGTRIEVVTEGILTRIVQNDPGLEEYGLVIFDEFHERNLHGDLGLALALQSQDVLRKDLRILVMSATLDIARVSSLLGKAPSIHCAGKQFPVDIQYYPPRAGLSPESAVPGAVKRALRDSKGDILVFLPGMGEIARVESELRTLDEMQRGIDIHTLHSSIPAERQDAAIRPSLAGIRKIVLATSIAETSITIDGVTAVVDSGLSRVPRFSPRTGLTRLETVRVSRASAEQRAGRAGRTAPGTCYRIWNEHEQHSLLERWVPEILDADLVPMLLDLAVAGVREVGELRWLDEPPDAALSTARQILTQLGAIDATGRATEHGKEMSRLALHPRLAHMVLKSRALRLMPLACDVAALLEERDIVRSDTRGEDVDLRTRVQILNRWRNRGPGTRSAPADTDAGALDRVLRESERLRKATRAGDAVADERAAGLLLAFAYPDRIALRRDAVSSRFLLRNGTGAALPVSQALSRAEMIVVADLDGRKPESRVWLAAPVDTADIITHFGDQIEVESAHEWDDDTRSVRAIRRERLGAMVLRETAAVPTDAGEAARILAARLIDSKLTLVPWSDSARALRERVGFLRHHDPAWPDFSDEGLLATANEWLAPQLQGLRSLADVKRLDMTDVLMEMIGWQLRRKLDDLAPSHIAVPSGSQIPVDYSDPQAPMIAVRLQELFGLADTPRVLGGRVPVTVQLLSPARRPVQVTRDLASFWRTSYFDVRKEMRGRYPRHHWPENPMEAEATRRTKRR